MPLVPLKFKAGIVKDITEYASGQAGYYTDGNLVRFRNGFAEKVGGWLEEEYSFNADQQTPTTVTGKPKHLISWRSIIDSFDRIIVGTHNHLYLINNGVFYDITPLRKTSSNLSNPLVTTNNNSVVTVTDNSHGAQTGDFIVIKQATAVGGISADTINRLEGYQITKVNDNSYTFISGSQASSGATGGGTAIDIQYLIGNSDGVGFQSSDPALGYGVGSWGESTWGTARDVASSTVNIDATNWSLELWGDDVLINNREGQLYYWDTSAGDSARAVLASTLGGASGIPTKIRTIAVSFPDRHLIAGGAVPLAGGAIDPMLVRFSTQEDFAIFTPTSTNTAGDQRLEVGEKIICMTPTKDEMFIQTDEAAYGMSFVGPPFTFSFRLLAVNCGGVALHGTANVDGDVYWIGKNNFFVYDGAIKELPCSVQYYVFDRMQKRYFDKIYVGHNKRYNEVTWFYVSEDNTLENNPEPDSYVTYNYQDGAWTIGTLDRNVWHDAQGFRQVPFAFDADGKLYDHETGTTDNGSPMNAHIESGDIELDTAGENLFIVDRVIPDATMNSNTNLFLQLKTRKYPNAPETVKGAFTITSETEKVSTRAKGRQMAVRFFSNGTQDQWLLGDFRVNARKDGLR
tara:strand:- start:4774 stop:6657 length:1884 start_codon:yes stop_codon:yes gene_type:complete